MPTVLDAVGHKSTRTVKERKGKTQQTWLAGQSTKVGERPSGIHAQFYDALGQISDSTKELNEGDNIAFGLKAKPVLEEIVIGAADLPGKPASLFIVPVEFLTEAAQKKLKCGKYAPKPVADTEESES